MRGKVTVILSIIGFSILVILAFMRNAVKTHPATVTPKDVTVYAGVGVPGVAEIGMSYRDLKRLRRNVTLVKKSWTKHVSLPDIGAEAPLHAHESARSPISFLRFNVSAKSATNIYDGSVSPVFTGSVEGGLDFSKPVSVEDVERVFGELPVIETVVIQKPINVEDILKSRGIKLISDGECFNLSYFDRGISFRIDSNVVTSFSIYTPHGE